MITQVKDVRERIKNRFMPGSNTPVVDPVLARLKELATLPTEEIYHALDADPRGLSQNAAEERVTEYGANEVHHEQAPSWFTQLLQSFVNPFIGILIVIALVSMIMDVWMAPPGEADYKTVIVVSVMVMVSSLLRFFQEFAGATAQRKPSKAW